MRLFGVFARASTPNLASAGFIFHPFSRVRLAARAGGQGQDSFFKDPPGAPGPPGCPTGPRGAGRVSQTALNGKRARTNPPPSNTTSNTTSHTMSSYRSTLCSTLCSTFRSTARARLAGPTRAAPSRVAPCRPGWRVSPRVVPGPSCRPLSPRVAPCRPVSRVSPRVARGTKSSGFWRRNAPRATESTTSALGWLYMTPYFKTPPRWRAWGEAFAPIF